MLKSAALNLLVMAILTVALFRLLVIEVPHLPWEPALPGPNKSATPVVVESGPLRIGVGDRPAYLLLRAAVTDLATGPKLQIVDVPDASERWAMLADGRLDMACGTMDSYALASLHQRVGSYLFSVGSGVGEDVILAQSGIGRMADLADKTVAVPRGGPGEYLLGLALSDAGLSLLQCHVVYTSTAEDAATLLQKGAAQAAVLWEPALSKVRGLPGATILANTADARMPHADEIGVVNLSALKQRRSDITALLTKYFSLVESLRSKPGLTRGHISEDTKVEPGPLTDYLKGVQFSTLTDNRNLEPASISRMLDDEQGTLGMMGHKPTLSNDMSKNIELDLVKQLPSTGTDD